MSARFISLHYPNVGAAKEGLVSRSVVLAFAIVFVSSVLTAQQVLDDESIVKLVKAGLSDDVVISTINASPGNYNIAPDSLIALKSSGVSDKIISAVVAHVSTAPSPASTPEPPVPTEGASSGSARVPAGARVVIAPMGGFETYFAAAVREKRVPIQLTLDKALRNTLLSRQILNGRGSFMALVELQPGTTLAGVLRTGLLPVRRAASRQALC